MFRFLAWFGVGFVVLCAISLVIVLVYLIRYEPQENVRRQEVCRDAFGSGYTYRDQYQGIDLCTSSDGDIKAFPNDEVKS